MTDLPRGYGSAAEEPFYDSNGVFDFCKLEDDIAEGMLAYFRLTEELDDVLESINELCYEFEERTGCGYDPFTESKDWWRKYYSHAEREQTGKGNEQ